MRNLRLSVKIGVLVAVLLSTIVVVAIVGVVQLTDLDARFEHMVNTTGQAIQLSGDGRIELLTAIRNEKNAILAPDKAQAAEFADHARQSLKRLKEISSELEALVGVNLATPEGKATSELGRAVEELEANQKELLRWAVLKANAEGERLVIVDLFGQVRELEDFVDGLGGRDGEKGSAPATAADGAKLGAGRQAIDRFYELLFRLIVHLNSVDEQEMNRLDGEIRQSVAALQDAIRRFSGMLGESERSEAPAVFSSFDAIKSRVAQVQQLSRTNSDHRAREISITSGVAAGNRCNELLAAARRALKDRLAADVRDVSRATALGRNVVISAAVLGAVISLLLAVLTIRSITRPVDNGVRVFEAIAAGDLTRRMNLDQKDEIGRLGAASDEMAGALCRVVTQVRQLADNLGQSAGSLSGVSNDLLSQSQSMSGQAETVAAGTEQMSTNISTMAAAAEQMSVNVAGISSASEEVSVNVASIVDNADATSRSVGSVAESVARITASLQDVARDARHGSQMTQQARDMAGGATAAMRQLDQAASEITKVTEVIKSIALQTNLLALNATIEATSAGEAGKGFAVVAGEVKELASQSANSAEEIARKIESVQSSTRDAVKVIENVAQFIGKVNESAGRISDAVDGQTQTAGQIVAAVEQARHGVESIARSIAEVAKGATDVSRNTAEAATAATDVSRNASEAARASEMISANIHNVSDAT
ncbi:MAG: methyl-accepting chemotaxis protein, partial [Tepidisphaeraceae bacterium]